jgi:hypothetical protein
MVITLQVTEVYKFVYFLCRNYDCLSSRNPHLPARLKRVSFIVWRMKTVAQKSRYVIGVWTLPCAVTPKKHRPWLLPAKDI